MLIFDYEVFKYDWLVGFKNLATNEYKIIVNDEDELHRFYQKNKDIIHFGFNNKRYDNLVYRAQLDGANPFNISKMIIEYENPLRVYRTYDIFKWWYPSMDISQDTMRGSLKEFEGYMGLDIDESTIPFDIDRKLTEEEIQEVISYNISDLDATHEVMKRSIKVLETKMALIKEFKLTTKDLDKTNAQLVAKILGAEKVDYGDEFTPFPFENHTLSLPTHLGEVRVKNKVVRMSTIEDFYNKEPNYEEKLHIDILGVPHILGYGGLHGSEDKYSYEGELWLLDAKQYYPNIMIQFDYLSRAVKGEKREQFKYIVANRDAMRDIGETVKAENYKLISNTTFGASKARFNDMYDPKMANNICISGQLMLIDLLHRLGDSVKLVQSNTDGILVIPKDKVKIEKEVDAWEKRHNLKMDIEVFKQLYQKDVNNYISVGVDDSVTVKGGYVSQTTVNGHRPFNMRKTGKIIDDAVVNYFVNKIIPEQTINSSSDKLDFQLIRKTGRTYDGTVWENNGVDVEVNMVNRVYATKDSSMGKLYKVREGKRDSVPSLPEHCHLANKDDFDIKNLDRQYYIDEAWRRIRDYEK